MSSIQGAFEHPRAFSSSVRGPAERYATSGLSFPRLRHPNNQRLSGTPCPTPQQSRIVGGPVSDTPTIGDCRGPRSVGAGPFRSHGRGRPCRPQAPGLQPIKWRGLLLPDSSPRPSAGSGRSQNDSCGQFACHEMKNRPCIFISWRVFPAISLKYSHEMKKSLYFLGMIYLFTPIIP